MIVSSSGVFFSLSLFLLVCFSIPCLDGVGGGGGVNINDKDTL